MNLVKTSVPFFALVTILCSLLGPSAFATDKSRVNLSCVVSTSDPGKATITKDPVIFSLGHSEQIAVYAENNMALILGFGVPNSGLTLIGMGNLADPQEIRMVDAMATGSYKDAQVRATARNASGQFVGASCTQISE